MVPAVHRAPQWRNQSNPPPKHQASRLHDTIRASGHTKAGEFTCTYGRLAHINCNQMLYCQLSSFLWRQCGSRRLKLRTLDATFAQPCLQLLHAIVVHYPANSAAECPSPVIAVCDLPWLSQQLLQNVCLHCAQSYCHPTNNSQKTSHECSFFVGPDD